MFCLINIVVQVGKIISCFHLLALLASDVWPALTLTIDLVTRGAQCSTNVAVTRVASMLILTQSPEASLQQQKQISKNDFKRQPRKQETFEFMKEIDWEQSSN